jgi:hypothetical protein
MRTPSDTGTVKSATTGPAEPALDYETQAPKLVENGTTCDPIVPDRSFVA